MKRTTMILALVLVAGSACGTPPNHRLLNRTSSYMKAMSFGMPTGYPVDIEELERRFPELKGLVVTAPMWVEEYDIIRKDAEERGVPVNEYRIPFGASLTIEVVGETGLTRSYAVPPTGFIHYPYLKKLKVVGLTTDELKKHLEKELSAYIRKPEVLVHINSSPYQPNPIQPFYQQTFGTSDIIVMGVAATRFFSNIVFTGRETLVGVLSQTSLPEEAEWRQIRIIRRDTKDPLRKSRVIVCDLWDYFAKADVRQDVPLVPGDVIFVPVRWSTDDQFWEDWGYVRRVINEVFFLDTFRDSVRKGGSLRNP